MQIHVVNQGDSVWTIAQGYGVSSQLIIEANQLSNPDRLVIGQALVIPTAGRFHWVRPGETLASISHLYNVPIQQLIYANHLTSATLALRAGYQLYIPNESRQKPTIDVATYVDLNITGEQSPIEVEQIGELLTYVQIFSYHLNRDGSLTSIDDQSTIQAAYNKQVVPLMVIANIEEGGFSTDIATIVLQDENLQERMLNEAIALMDEKGYLGLDFDLEYLGAENRDAYHQLLRKARTRLDEKGYLLSSALAPQTEAGMQGVLYEGHDYATHGEMVDVVFLMTYEWGWTGGPPMAVAPINQVRRVIEYATSVIPAYKIMMGIPLYGYDWTLPYVEGETRARAIDHQQAIELAATYNAEIQYDWQAKSPYFTYYDEEGFQHEVWFEDARSIQAKFDLVKEFGLRGFFYWVLGWDFPQNWLLINENFTVNKRVR